METTQLTQNPQSDKHSNIKTCITESWKVFALHTSTFFKYLWFHFIIAGLGFALFSTQLKSFLTEHWQPQAAYISSGYDPTLAEALFGPSAMNYATFAAAFIAFLLANYIMYGAVFSQIRFFKATGELPKAHPFAFWHEVRQDGVKTLAFDFIFTLIISICSVLITLIAKFTSWWVMLALIPMTIYWIVISLNGRLQYVVEKKGFKEALKAAFTIGHRHFGGYLILIILTSIPAWLISYAALLPGHVIQMSYSADTISRLTGDPSGIPPYVMVLFIAVATLGYSILAFIYTLQQWPIALYTSAVCQSKTSQAAASSIK